MSPQAEYVRGVLRPLVVASTGLAPKLPRLEGIRAVVFDLYGTLLISSAGGAPAGELVDPEGLPGFEEGFWRLVREHQERRRAAGVLHPEVDVREIRTETLRLLGKPVPGVDELEFDALAHECRFNPVWPMPGAGDLLATLRGMGRLLGIISNAQFYTLPVMEGLFGANLDGLGFHPRLRVFSFEEGEGKPSPRLFERLSGEAASLGVAPEAILYIGNDFRKDILPARSAGFRTALFAGDSRSLRLGGIPEAEAVSTADAVITDLAQVAELL